MRVGAVRVASLLPYAVASVAVMVASAIALAATVRPAAVDPGVAVGSPVPPSPARRAELSDPRMAYWRTAASGSLELWVSDLDGGRRWPIATASGDADVALTRWAPDGSAIAYRTGGGTIGVVGLDGSLASLVMPLDMRRAGWRIVSYEWSPDAKRIAATFRAGRGLANESDVYVIETRSGAGWQRVSTLGDAYAGAWIDADRLFIESSSGLVAMLDLRTSDLRPVTALPAASPQLGRDGRVWFIGGGTVTADVSSQPVATGWVWSSTLAGDGLRREIAVEHGQARLHGTVADGRAVIGIPGGLYLASDALVPLVFSGAGSVRRVFVSDDGKRLMGLTDSRILHIDAARIPKAVPPGQLAPAEAATTLLSGIRDPDVWTARRAVAPSDAPRTPAADAPPARLAFTLGHAVWEMLPDGTAKALATQRGTLVGPPRWSPAGDQVAVTYVAPSERDANNVLVVGPGGPVRWRVPLGAQRMTWSPDGKTLTFWVATGTRLDQWSTHAFDPATGRSLETIPGRAVWAAGGRAVITDGEPVTATGLRAVQRIELVTGAARRIITDAQRLAASPLLRDVPDATRQPLVTHLYAVADPAYLGVRLSRLANSQAATTRSHAYVTVRVSDGEPVHVTAMPAETGPSELAWSPKGSLMGFGRSDVLPSTETIRRAMVIDPISGRTLLSTEGRFAGWAPDGAWVYVARDDGLYAYRVDATMEPLRISALGVIASAAGRS